ncbi:MAG: hypothetical protein QOE14_1208, partial [Humisphaera sp.]|nr:hypothetical protein [Humisphaera sp.]
MIRTRTVLVLFSAVSMAVIVSGCRPKSGPTKAGKPLDSPVMTDTDKRMSELQRRSHDLAGVVKELPGRDAREDRELVAKAFDATHDALTMMGGPAPGGALRQQLRIIENIRQFLRSADEKLSYDPAVDAGLRATHSALEGVRERLFPADQNVQAQVHALGERLSELDQVRGPMHSVVVAQVFQSASNAIDTMGGILNARSQAITQQTPAPAPPPTRGPAPALPTAVPAAASAP